MLWYFLEWSITAVSQEKLKNDAYTNFLGGRGGGGGNKVHYGKWVRGLWDETNNGLNQHCQLSLYLIYEQSRSNFFILNSFVPLCVKLKDNVLKCVFVGV